VYGGDDLQIWRLATNILNKESRTVDKRKFITIGLSFSQNKFNLSYTHPDFYPTGTRDYFSGGKPAGA
jgi:hypothetical protein